MLQYLHGYTLLYAIPLDSAHYEVAQMVIHQTIPILGIFYIQDGLGNSLEKTSTHYNVVHWDVKYSRDKQYLTNYLCCCILCKNRLEYLL